MAILIICAYVLIGRAILALTPALRDFLFAMLNLGALFALFYWSTRDPSESRFRIALFAAYITMASFQYATLRLFCNQQGMMSWIAFLAPIAFLAIIRYGQAPEALAILLPDGHALLQDHPEMPLNASFVGISYLAFRTSLLALEVRNDLVPMPSFWQYLSFAFFLPTLVVGPISHYSQYWTSFAKPREISVPVGQAALRILVGAVKYRFFGPVLYQLTYSGLLLDGHPHHWVDLLVAALAYYLYLYCNFSGFCDMGIGCAGLMGISVAENFNSPLFARNLQEFWNRWHISLSHYMRDVVFTPLSKLLTRVFGPKRINEVLAVTTMVVFLLVGVWHGTGWHYAAFGAAHGIGLAVNQYYTVFLKRRLGRAGLIAYRNNRVMHTLAVIVTFAYVTGCLFLFANDGAAMYRIFSVIRW